MIHRVQIERLAPTGEGIARGPEGVGFVAGALPGEEVDAEVLEQRRTYWRGRTLSVLVPSRDRRPTARGCGGCDWAHLDLAAARREKRELFLETMDRIGKIPATAFGDLPVAPSPLGYRLRSRFQVSGRGEDVRIGSFVPRTHSVEPITGCEALSPAMRDVLPRLREEIAGSGLGLSQIATLEDLAGERRIARITLDEDPVAADRAQTRSLADRLASLFDWVTIQQSDGIPLWRGPGAPRLTLKAGGRRFSIGVDTFFQSNRFLLDTLYRDVREEVASLPPGPALDAFGGAGFFAGAMLDAGHEVTSVEEDPKAASDAHATRQAWEDRHRWRFLRVSVSAFLPHAESFPIVLVDPPRAGLSAAARPLARIAEKKMIYVSCEPATLARDLSRILSQGFQIEGTRLYDLFPLTHRVEAVVTLARKAAASRKTGIA